MSPHIPYIQRICLQANQNLKTYRNYTENELVEMLKDGSNKGFSYLYLHYSRSLYRIIFAIVPEKELATDILQEVFVNIFSKIYTYDANKTKLYTWMAAITKNICIDILKSKSYRNGRLNKDMSAAHDVPSPIKLSNAEGFHLKSIFTKLDVKYSNILELSYFQGYTQQEIAIILGLPLGTVKTRIKTGLVRLRRMLED